MTPQPFAPLGSGDDLAELDLADLDLTGLSVVAMRDVVALPETGASFSSWPSCILLTPSCSSIAN